MATGTTKSGVASITVDEWAKALEEAYGRGATPSGFTSAEIAAATGHSATFVRMKLGQLIALGVARLQGHKRITCINGRSAHVPCYSLIPREKRSSSRVLSKQ